jgi:hypothetical protein
VKPPPIILRGKPLQNALDIMPVKHTRRWVRTDSDRVPMQERVGWVCTIYAIKTQILPVVEEKVNLIAALAESIAPLMRH